MMRVRAVSHLCPRQLPSCRPSGWTPLHRASMERHSLRDAAIEIASAAWTRYRTAMRLTFLAVLAGLCLSLDALAAGASAPAASVVLVGDSTLAHRSGYGDALCARFQPEVTCFNL